MNLSLQTKTPMTSNQLKSVWVIVCTDHTDSSDDTDCEVFASYDAAIAETVDWVGQRIDALHFPHPDNWRELVTAKLRDQQCVVVFNTDEDDFLTGVNHINPEFIIWQLELRTINYES